MHEIHTVSEKYEIKIKIKKNAITVHRKLDTYLKGVPPHPAMAVKILGPRSLAGFKPNPALIPNVVPIVKTISPIKNGAMLAPTPMFF